MKKAIIFAVAGVVLAAAGGGAVWWFGMRLGLRNPQWRD